MFAWEILHIAAAYAEANGGKREMSEAEFDQAVEALAVGPDTFTEVAQ